jgi:hypothetical protein
MTKLKQIQTKLSVIGTTVLFAAACSSGSPPEATGNAPETAQADEAESPSPQTEWVATTPSGLKVTLRPMSVPISIGTVAFHIEFAGESPDPSLLSLDLITPDMPMMGVRRFALEPHEGGFMAMTDIPMAGLWNAYVNIGVGTEAAEFAFDVQAAPGGATHQMN